MRAPTEETAVAAVRADLGTLNGADIEAAAFLVMMKAARFAREDLRIIMHEVKEIDYVKEKQRQADSRANVDVSGIRCQAAGAAAVARRPYIGNVGFGPRPMPKADFISKIEESRNDRDAMSELDEMESLRLQMAMDRMSKLMSTLSTMQKKMADTGALPHQRRRQQ